MSKHKYCVAHSHQATKAGDMVQCCPRGQVQLPAVKPATARHSYLGLRADSLQGSTLKSVTYCVVTPRLSLVPAKPKAWLCRRNMRPTTVKAACRKHTRQQVRAYASRQGQQAGLLQSVPLPPGSTRGQQMAPAQSISVIARHHVTRTCLHVPDA